MFFTVTGFRSSFRCCFGTSIKMACTVRVTVLRGISDTKLFRPWVHSYTHHAHGIDKDTQINVSLKNKTMIGKVMWTSAFGSRAHFKIQFITGSKLKCSWDHVCKDVPAPVTLEALCACSQTAKSNRIDRQRMPENKKIVIFPPEKKYNTRWLVFSYQTRPVQK